MASITVTCAHCQFSRDIPEQKIPAGTITVTCPKCRKNFSFTKTDVVQHPAEPTVLLAGAMIMEHAAKKIAQPAAPQKTAPPKPSQKLVTRPVMGEPVKAVPPKTGRVISTRKRIIAAILGVILIAVITVSIRAHIYKRYQVLGEKLLIAGIYSRFGSVQQYSIKALREYPSKDTALSLILFINMKNMTRMPDPKKKETYEEQMKREKKKKSDLMIAEQAVETLCLLSGQSFKTDFKQEKHGEYSWSGISEKRWPSVLWAINSWALMTFAPGDIDAGSSGIIIEPQLPAPGGTQK